MSSLNLTFFGLFQVTLDDRPITHFRSANIQGLLVYLALQADRAFPRDVLMTLFWPDEPEQIARANFRQSLYLLRKLLKDDKKQGASDAPPFFLITRQTVQFNPKSNYTLDVTRFRQAVEQSDWAGALSHYGGELLPGFNCESLDFEEWLLLEREHWHQQMQEVISFLVEEHISRGDYVAAQRSALRLLEFDPWSEPAHRYLIQALAAQGEIQAALSQYTKCYNMLQEEFGVEPSPATQALAERLRNGNESTPPLRHNLVAQLKSLIGREEESERLCQLVSTERLVSLLGIGGVGKSHLAQVAASKVVPMFPHGVWFVSLTSIESNATAPDRIAVAIAAAIGFPIIEAQAPLSDLTVYLADKQLLLVLDNWEHLVHAAEDVLYPLLTNTDVHILTTSRIRLMVEGEIFVSLDGLPQAQAYTLFVERARRIVPNFADEGKEPELTPHIYEICQQVAGLPLGIELAASWVEHFTVAEISQSIAEITVEPHQANSLAGHHQSLNGVFEYSWRLLSSYQQQMLAQFSIFRGGFDRVAAAAVAHSSLSELSILLGHSLVQRVLAGRYDLHPLVQEFAVQKLSPDQVRALRDRHSHHYLDKLATLEHTQYADQLLSDYENIRRAWQSAVYAGDFALLQQSGSCLGSFIRNFGLMSDGDKLFQNAIKRFDSDPQHGSIIAQLLYELCIFRKTASIRAQTSLLNRVLTLTEDIVLQSKAHIDLANNYAEEGAWEQVHFHFDQVEKLTRGSSDLGVYIDAVASRIFINTIHFRGDFAQGIARLEEMLELLDTATNPIDDKENLRTRVLNSLRFVAIRYGDYALAIRNAHQLLERANSLAYKGRLNALLDLALAEQFAGMYVEAVDHNLQALALAEESERVDDSALLKANLCMTMRQNGELEKGLAYGLDAIESLASQGLARMEGQARNRVGHILLTLERWDDANKAYTEAIVVWEPQQHPNRYEAVAGQAVAAVQQGKQKEGLAQVQEVLEFVEDAGLVGIVDPVFLLLNCERVLSTLGHTIEARQALKRAEDWVQLIAGRISDDTVRYMFLHNRFDNQVLKNRISFTI
ncbi:MAG: BTAD domain-containing putative transcriptional regulator [Chloroflexota bacterium]